MGQLSSHPRQSNQLRISEIFYSLQGETDRVGLPTVFVRLTGCPLRCVYCDTAYAFSGGEWKSYQEILQSVAQYPTQWVTVTGGEPLAQPGCISLLKQLCDHHYEVSLETSGALDVSLVDERVVKVIDLKTPSSGELSRNLYQNIDYLQHQDKIKFVLGDREDYDWSIQTIRQYALNDKCEILMSPVFDKLPPQQLADWILQDGLRVRMQLQMHKLLWGDVAGK